jgi:hypothetical protein
MLKTVSTQLALASDTLSEILAKGNTSGPNNIIMDAGYGINGTLGATTAATVAATTGTFSSTLASGGITTTGNTAANAATAGEGKYFPNNTYGAFVYGQGTTYDVALGQRTTGVALGVLAGTTNVVLPSGNLVLASGSGIDFSATAGTGTSELLDDYEEGTWTPVGNGVTLTLNTTASYIKVGTLVTVFWDATWPATANASAANVTGLPFTVLAGGGSAVGYTNSGLEVHYNVGGSTTLAAYLNTAAAVTNAQMSGARIIVSGSYTVS